MRLDDFDPNINVEDQRGRGGGFNLAAVARGHAARPAAVRVQPVRLRRRGRPADRVRGVRWRAAVPGRRRESAVRADPRRSASNRPAAPTRNRAARSTRRARRPATPSARPTRPGPRCSSMRASDSGAQAGLLWRQRPIGLRRGAERDGAVLLPDRPGHLSRHQLLRRTRQPLRREGRFRRRTM